MEWPADACNDGYEATKQIRALDNPALAGICNSCHDCQCF